MYQRFIPARAGNSSRSHEVGGSHQRWRQRFQDRVFEDGYRLQAGMLGGPNLKIDAGTPSLAQGIDGRAHLTGKGLDTVEFTKRRCR